DHLPVRRGDHGDPAAVRRDGELVNYAVIVDDLLGPPGVQVELPDLGEARDSVAVVDVLVLLPQFLPAVADDLRAGDVVDGLAVGRHGDVLDAARGAGGREGRPFAAIPVPIHRQPPDLGLAVVGRALLVAVLAVAQEVNEFLVGIPLRRTVAGP